MAASLSQGWAWFVLLAVAVVLSANLAETKPTPSREALQRQVAELQVRNDALEAQNTALLAKVAGGELGETSAASSTLGANSKYFFDTITGIDGVDGFYSKPVASCTGDNCLELKQNSGDPSDTFTLATDHAFLTKGTCERNADCGNFTLSGMGTFSACKIELAYHVSKCEEGDTVRINTGENAGKHLQCQCSTLIQMYWYSRLAKSSSTTATLPVCRGWYATANAKMYAWKAGRVSTTQKEFAELCAKEVDDARERKLLSKKLLM